AAVDAGHRAVRSAIAAVRSAIAAVTSGRCAVTSALPAVDSSLSSWRAICPGGSPPAGRQCAPEAGTMGRPRAGMWGLGMVGGLVLSAASVRAQTPPAPVHHDDDWSCEDGDYGALEIKMVDAVTQKHVTLCCSASHPEG